MLSDDHRDTWPNGHYGEMPRLPRDLAFQNRSSTRPPFDFNGRIITDSTYAANPRASSLLDTGYPTTADLNVVFQIVGSPNGLSSLMDFRTPEASRSTNSHITKNRRSGTVIPASSTHIGPNYVLGIHPDTNFSRTPNGHLTNAALSPELSSDFEDGNRHQSRDPPLHELEHNLNHGETSSQTPVKKRRRVDITKRTIGPNKYGRTGTLKCDQCRRRNSKCSYSDLWLPCQFCEDRNIDGPCTKVPGPKAMKLLDPSPQIPTANDAKISGKDVLLLQSMYVIDRGSPMARSLISRFARAYGPSIHSHALRHAVLAYAASLLPHSLYSDRSDHHAAEAISRLRLRLFDPEMLDETDAFAASILGRLLWRRDSKDSSIHAKGVMDILEFLWKRGRPQSTMLRVFGPLVNADAIRNYNSVSYPSEPSTQYRTTFKARIEYYQQLIRFGKPTIVWCSANVQALAGLLWDLQHTMLGLLLEAMNRGTDGYDERDSRVKYLWSEYDDPDVQEAIARMGWPEEIDRRIRSVDEEVRTYLSHQMLCIGLLRIALTAPSILQAFGSAQAQDIADEQLLRGSSHQLLQSGDAFEFYTWAFVLNLGISGLAYSSEQTPEGCSWVLEELRKRRRPELEAALRVYWGHRDLDSARSVIELVDAELCARFGNGGPKVSVRRMFMDPYSLQTNSSE